MKESIVFQKVGSRDFWRIANSILNRGKSAILYLFNGPEVLTSASDKVKLFAQLFSKNSNLDDPGHELPSFNCRTDITLSNMVITLKMAEKEISIASVPVFALKNCEPELSFILTNLSSLLCLKESFQCLRMLLKGLTLMISSSRLIVCG